MGRPSLLTSERQAQICHAIGEGVPVKVAAAMAGVSERTYYNWMDKGRQHQTGRYVQFVQAVTRALDDLHAELAQVVTTHAMRDPRIAIEILKRRWPDEWGNTMRVTGAGGGPIAVTTREQAVKDGKERARHLRAV